MEVNSSFPTKISGDINLKFPKGQMKIYSDLFSRAGQQRIWPNLILCFNDKNAKYK